VSVRILIGDCREKLRELPDNSVDSVVCDPPYHLTSIVKRFGAENAAPAQVGKTGAYARASKGFMGQTWDGGDVAFQPETWAEVLRVLKPGGHLVAFSGTRTYHRMAVAIEDAGFEVRDMIAWHYGSRFSEVARHQQGD
jgi:site-specific DNA-methyltransferase (adenine-specific)